MLLKVYRRIKSKQNFGRKTNVAVEKSRYSLRMSWRIDNYWPFNGQKRAIKTGSLIPFQTFATATAIMLI